VQKSKNGSFVALLFLFSPMNERKKERVTENTTDFWEKEKDNNGRSKKEEKRERDREIEKREIEKTMGGKSTDDVCFDARLIFKTCRLICLCLQQIIAFVFLRYSNRRTEATYKAFLFISFYLLFFSPEQRWWPKLYNLINFSATIRRLLF